MSDELVNRGKRGDFNDYEKFITKTTQVKLTPHELRIIDELDGKVKPFYDQTLF